MSIDDEAVHGNKKSTLSGTPFVLGKAGKRNIPLTNVSVFPSPYFSPRLLTGLSVKA